MSRSNKKQLFVECTPDEILVKSLINGLYKIIHSGGKSKIANRIKKMKKQVAMVDEDPGSTSHPYYEKLKTIYQDTQCKIIVKSDTASENVIITIQPRLEEWLLHICKMNNIDIKLYSLPEDGASLHSVINLYQSNYIRLIKDLKNTQCFKKLKEILHKYSK